MFDRDRWLEIAHTVLSNKLRTSLTGLSIALGVFILVVMQGLGFGLQNGAKNQFADDATNSMWLRTGRTQMAYEGHKPNRFIRLDNATDEAMREQVDTIPGSSRMISDWGMRVTRADKGGSFGMRGVDPDYQALDKTKMTAGRYLNARDIADQRKLAVVGQELVDQLWPSGTQPSEVIGDRIQMNGVTFLIVGAYNEPGSRWGNGLVYMPFTTAQSLYTNGNTIDEIVLSTGDKAFEKTEEEKGQLHGWLRERFHVHPEDERGVHVRNANEDAEIFSNIFRGIELFIWGIGLMTLLAGAMGVANIMAIVVKERTVEIGVRKALGATGGGIVGLLVQESVSLMLLSGSLGLMAGVALLRVVAPMVDHEFFMNPQVDLQVSLLALAILVVIGAVSAIAPALRAVRISPVEALRDE